MNLFDYSLIIILGIIAGFINTMAGGGSLLTIPILIFLGLPSAVANGTNRLAVLIQSFAAVGKFKKEGYFDLKLGFMFSIPAIVGSYLGSLYAINLSDQMFNRILGSVMLLMVIVIVIQPQKKFKQFQGTSPKIGMILFFFVGVYGGVIQAGAGFFIMMALTLATTFSLVRINAMKMLIVAIYMIPSLFLFIRSGNINWTSGFVLAAANSLGAYLGSKLQIDKGDKIVKIALVIIVLGLSLRFLGIVEL